MRGLRALTVIAATVTIGATGTLGAAAEAQPHPAPPRAAAMVPARICPPGILPLPAAGVQHAADQALAEAAKLYGGLNTRGAQVMAADRSAFAGVRGHQLSNL